MTKYSEPLLAILVLDFLKPEETKICLESIQSHVKVNHETIYLHNGNGDHAYQFFKDGLVDRFIQRRVNGGLGLGTRDLFAGVFSPYCLYLQNDQQLIKDINDNVFKFLVQNIDAPIQHPIWPAAIIKSFSLAGPVCGAETYSERAHFINTSFYKDMENKGILGHYGAGPWHDGTWRERQIQDYYEKNYFIHDTSLPSFVQDNGKLAKRENPDGSLWQHRTDTKELKLIHGPVKEKHIYPAFTEDEWSLVLSSQTWPEGQIPEKEKTHSFKVWK